MNNLILIGLPGSGKTTVGRLLGEKLGMPLADVDEEVVRRSGKTVEQLFREEGEAAFRRWESRCLADLCAGEGQIIATGGGCILSAENRSVLGRSGLVIFLDRRAEDIALTLNISKSRPLLAAGHTLEELSWQRRPLYLVTAHAAVTAPTAEAAAEAAVELWVAHRNRSL